MEITKLSKFCLDSLCFRIESLAWFQIGKKKNLVLAADITGEVGRQSQRCKQPTQPPAARHERGDTNTRLLGWAPNLPLSFSFFFSSTPLSLTGKVALPELLPPPPPPNPPPTSAAGVSVLRWPSGPSLLACWNRRGGRVRWCCGSSRRSRPTSWGSSGPTASRSASSAASSDPTTPGPGTSSTGYPSSPPSPHRAQVDFSIARPR
jgi:hypothetical protein